MKKLFKYLKDYKKESIIAPLFKLLEALFDLCVPLVVANIINNGITAGEAGKPYIYRMCILLVGLAVVGLVCAIMAQYFAAKAAVGFSTKLRGALFSHIQKLSFSDLDSLGTAELENRMTMDVNQLQNGVNMALRLLLRSPFIVFGSMAMAFVVNTNVAVVFAVAIPIMGLIVALVLKITTPKYKTVQANQGRLLGITRENLLGVRVVRAFGREQDQIEKFSDSNSRLYKSQIVVGRISALLNPATTAIINLGIVAILSTGAIRIDIGGMAQGDAVALIDYMSQILIELIKLANTIVLLSKTFASGDRVSAVLDITPGMQYAKGVALSSEKKGRVEFKNVSFNYAEGGEDDLRDISFVAEPGETIGIIGATASGKTTLINLLARYYDVGSGEVLIDGQDVRTMDRETINKKVEVVMQKAALFKGTIRENLAMAREGVSDEDIYEALRIAQAVDVVEGKENKLAEMVEQGGRNFSGGQRQRLAIARTLLKNSEILVLDDSSSALDYKTDAALRQAIAGMQANKKPTTFIVSQRTSSLMKADKILVMDEGRLVGIGTHEELLNNCEIYREIYASQFKGGEQ